MGGKREEEERGVILSLVGEKIKETEIREQEQRRDDAENKCDWLGGFINKRLKVLPTYPYSYLDV